MIDRDRILIETTRTQRGRLLSAMVHGALPDRRRVNTNVGRLIASAGVAVIIGIGCMGTALVVGLMEDNRNAKAVSAFRAAQAANPLKPGDRLIEIEQSTFLYDTATDSWVDPRTGFPVDPETGLATDPEGRLVDTRTGWFYDPATGLYTDPESGLTIDPTTLHVVEAP